MFLRVHPNVRKWLRDSWLLGIGLGMVLGRPYQGNRGRPYRGRLEVPYQGESREAVSREAEDAVSGEVGRVERDMKERKNAQAEAKI